MTSAETTLPGSRPCDAEPRGTPGVPGRHGWTAVSSSCSTCSTAKARVLEEKAPRLSERPGEGRRWESGRERGKGGNRQCRRPQEEALAGVLRFGIQSVFCPPALLTPTINTAEARSVFRKYLPLVSGCQGQPGNGAATPQPRGGEWKRGLLVCSVVEPKRLWFLTWNTLSGGLE